MSTTATAPTLIIDRPECNRRRRNDWVIRGTNALRAPGLKSLGCVYDNYDGLDPVWLAPSQAVADMVRGWRGVVVGTPGPRVPNDPRYSWLAGFAVLDVPIAKKNHAAVLLDVIDGDLEPELHAALVERAAGRRYCVGDRTLPTRTQQIDMRQQARQQARQAEQSRWQEEQRQSAARVAAERAMYARMEPIWDALTDAEQQVIREPILAAKPYLRGYPGAIRMMCLEAIARRQAAAAG